MSELRLIAEQVKKRVTVREVAARFGFNYGSGHDRDRYACPVCRETSSSKKTLSIFEGEDGYEHWHCFSCDVGGDCISWLAARLDCPPYQSIQRLATMLGVSVSGDAILAFLTDELGKRSDVVFFADSHAAMRAVRAEWWRWRNANPSASVDDLVVRLPVLEAAELQTYHGARSNLAPRVRSILERPTPEIPAVGQSPLSREFAENFRRYTDTLLEPECVEILPDRIVDVPEYVRERGWGSAAPFEVGYCRVGEPAPENVNEFSRHGLVYLNRRDGQHAMDGRVVFPIKNIGGRIVAFAGRTVVDHPVKYLNTKDTSEFKKGMTLFGLHENLRPILTARKVIVVEGYADVLAMRRHGSRLAVAAMGTAITPHHAEILSRVAREVVLLLDGDKAGREAATRAVDVLRSTRYSLSVATLPRGKDPDDCRPSEIRAALTDRRPADRPARGPGADWIGRLLTRS